MDTRNKVRLLVDVEPKAAVVVEVLGAVRLGHAIGQIVRAEDVFGADEEALHDLIAQDAHLESKMTCTCLARRDVSVVMARKLAASS